MRYARLDDGDGRGGLTLLELVVAATLFLLILGLVSLLLTALFSVSARGAAQAGLQQSAAVALRSMVRDLQRTTPGAVSLLPAEGAQDPVGFAGVPIATVSPRGTTVWEEGLVAYFWLPGQRWLVRKTWPPAPPELAVTFSPTRPPRLPASELESLGATTNGTERLMASDVQLFELTHPGGPPAVGQPITLRIVLERQVASNRVERVDLRRTVLLRNSGNTQ